MEEKRSVGRALAAAVASAVAVIAAMAPAAQAAGPRHALAGQVPGWTKHTRSLGHARQLVRARVYLAPQGGIDALKQAVVAVSTPGSATYHHFLTPAQYRARYEPTSATVSAVSAWLRSAGLTVSGVEGSRRYVTARGGVTAAEKAFGTTIDRFNHRGRVVQAPTIPVTVPPGVAGEVLAVAGLDTTPHVVKPTAFPPPAAFVNARPCSLFYGQVVAKFQADFKTPLPKFAGKYRDYAPCGYVPDQYRAAYEDNTSLDGTGQTVAIVDAFAASTIEQDADTYATRHGDPGFAPGQFSQDLPAKFKLHPKLCQTPQDWAGEETLDVEAVHAMAPAANVRYYGAKSCLDQDLNDALSRIVDANQASIVTNSYGGPEEALTSDGVAALEQPVLQGEMQGIGFTFSSGDFGDEVLNTGILQADYPASDPFVTAVGGTSAAIGPTGSLQFQTGWGTDKYNLSADGSQWVPIASDPFLYGSGGGFSTLFNRPSYQDGVVPAGSPSGRGVPDVAMDGDPTTGMLVGETQAFPDGTVKYGEYRIGGTSLSSPLFAGVQALAQQNAGARLGFANPAIYREEKAGGADFTDVVPTHRNDGNVRADFVNGVDTSGGVVYSLRSFGDDSSLATAPGWDDVTGVGTPNSQYLTGQTAP
jgi:subtilase family serine protease